MSAFQRMFLPIPVDLLYVWQVILDAGHDVLFVGGCVRDLIIGEPVHDYDLATSAHPGQIMALFPEVIPTGIQHGTVTVRHHGKSVEVTTFRIEDEYRDSRRPESVSFVSRVDEDLERRDFTCNSMAYRPDLGLLDLFDGLGDLKRHRLRSVGSASARFAEDALRMLRAVRFCAQLDLEPEHSLLVAAQIQQDLIFRLSKERIASEFSRMCGTRFISRLEAFAGTGVLRTAMAALGHTVADERALVHLLRQLLPGKDNPLGLPHGLVVPAGILAAILAEAGGTESVRAEVGEALAVVREAGYIRDLRNSLVQEGRFSSAVAAHAAALLLTLASLAEPVAEPAMVRVRRAASRVRVVCQLDPAEARETVALGCALLNRLLQQEPDKRWRGLPDWLNLVIASSFVEAAHKMQRQNDIVAIIELPVDGRDLMRLGFPAGRTLGNLLERLLRHTITLADRPDREQLLSIAAGWRADRT